jgi:tetratricopeptide (TPR) repeat protein
MDELLRRFLAWWNSLTPGARDQVVGGLIVASVVAVGSAAIGTARWLLRRLAPPAPQPPQVTPPQPITIQVQPAPPAPATERPVPRPPHRLAVPFIPRHDWEGRDWIERLSQVLGADGLVTLWGAGGTGKTALAREAANRFFPAPFSGGVTYDSADGRPDFSCVTLLDKVLTDFGREDARPLPPEPKADLVCRLLGEATPCLLLLDNFETIAREEQPAILQFLAQVPCPVLVTSREELPAGTNLRLGPMTPPEAEAFLRSLVERSPERARLERADLQQVAEVAERNPMLMRWVIRQVEQAQRPADVFDELAQGKGEAAVRIFGRSFGLLDADGQTALLALALFVPTASRQALAAVSGFDEDKTRLAHATQRLKQLDLLETDPAGERLSIVGLTRRLTQAQLQGEARARDLRERFVAHFLAYAEAHAQPTPEDYDALEAERENLLAAMDYAYTVEDWQSVMGLMDAVGDPVNGFLGVRGYWDDAIKRGQQAAEAAKIANDEDAEARFIGNLGTMLYSRGDYDRSRELQEESLKLRRKQGDERNMAVILHQLGMIAQAQGDYEQARRLYQESLDIERKLGNQAGIASSLHELGRLAQAQGDYEQARCLYQESLETFKKLDAQHEQAAVLHQLGMLAQAQGDYEQARRLYQESLDIEKKLGDQAGIARTSHQLGRLAQYQGDYEQARRLYQESLDIEKKLGNQAGIALTIAQTALLEEKTGNLEEALKLIRQAEEIFQRLGMPEAEQARRVRERLEQGGKDGGNG